jgi:hypothetical protein
MANTYQWVISGLHTRLNNEELGLEKVIESIHWRYQAEDANGNIADVYGSVGLEAPEADAFKSFEEITQADVEAWLESKLVVEQLQAGLDAKLEAIASPTHETLHLIQ